MRAYLVTAVVARRLVYLSAACLAVLYLKARAPDDIICSLRGPHTCSFGRRGLGAPLCTPFPGLAGYEVVECLPFDSMLVVCER